MLTAIVQAGHSGNHSARQPQLDSRGGGRRHRRTHPVRFNIQCCWDRTAHGLYALPLWSSSVSTGCPAVPEPSNAWNRTLAKSTRLSGWQ